MTTVLPSKNQNALLALIFFVFGIYILYEQTTNPGPGIPERAELKQASGSLKWLKYNRKVIWFSLNGEDKLFTYSGIGGGMDLIRKGLTKPDNPEITVLYFPKNSNGPLLSKHEYYGVFEIAVSGNTLRSYHSIEEGWKDNVFFGWLLGFALLFFSSVLSIRVIDAK